MLRAIDKTLLPLAQVKFRRAVHVKPLAGHHVESFSARTVRQTELPESFCVCRAEEHRCLAQTGCAALPQEI